MYYKPEVGAFIHAAAHTPPYFIGNTCERPELTIDAAATYQHEVLRYKYKYNHNTFYQHCLATTEIILARTSGLTFKLRILKL
jgi:hypothetical protein